MPTPPRDLPHLFVDGGGDRVPYVARGRGGAPKLPPARERVVHGTRLAAELNSAVATARATISERPEDFVVPPSDSTSRAGSYLEFELTGDVVPDALQSLEDRKKGIELVAVRPLAHGDVAATIFVPEERLDHFVNRVDEYLQQTTRRGKPKNLTLVASIEAVRLASPRSIFTDRPEDYPTDVQREFWWELWIRQGHESQIDAVAHRLGIVLKPHVVRFPERDVKVARATIEKLAHLMRQSDGLAELRLARDTPSFFLRESNVDQAGWVQDLLARLAPLPGTVEREVAVCLLDSGVTQGHPLLAPRLDPVDLLTVDPNWGTADDAPRAQGGGHGTNMAGIALFGDLTEAFTGNSAVLVPYRLESVKILPSVGSNEPSSYGAITTEAIARAEAAAPQRYRIVCMAVTAEGSGQGGRPSAWSAAIDQSAAGVFDSPRLIVLAVGNIREMTANWVSDYLDRNDTSEVESPAQSWNALTVGAVTEKLNILDPLLRGWTAVAPAGDLCPSSRTGLMFGSQWPVKPDVVLEGGNYAHDGGADIDAVDDLQLLTTGRQLAAQLVTAFGDSSAAAATAANLAARIVVARPSMWPETVRALLVHSAEWTPNMLARAEAAPGATRKRLLLRRYGYGVPSLARAIHSATNDLTLVVEDQLHPFRLDGSEIKTREMNIHSLPWPVDGLEALGEAEVELRVTLSYFVEPNPGERGRIRRHRYASHGLRFEVKGPLESEDSFRSRLSKAVELDEDNIVAAPGSEGWFLGPQARNTGSLHSDRWKGTAADLARRGAIGVYPIGGWWKEQRRLERYNQPARYSLIASIRTAEENVDIYTPVRIRIGVGVPVAITIEPTL